MGDFYAARSGPIPPLPWSSFPPPFPRPLFRAMASYCRRVATPAFCQQPPTSGYYGEILSYAFRDPPAKAEDCPGLTDILYQAK